MRLKKFVLPCVLLVASGLTVSAQAVPWCYGGTIVTVQTHNLDEGTLLFLFGSQTIPSGVDPLQEDRYIASTVGWDLAYASGRCYRIRPPHHPQLDPILSRVLPIVLPAQPPPAKR